MLVVDDSRRFEADRMEPSGIEHFLSNSLALLGVAGGVGRESFLHCMVEMLDKLVKMRWSVLLLSVMMMLLLWDGLVSKVLLLC